MNESGAERGAAWLTRIGLDQLIAKLKELGYQVVGPRLGDGAIVYDAIEGVKDLPAGWTEEQEAGIYRLRRREDDALFGYNLGPQSWKRFLHPPVLRILAAEKSNGEFRILPPLDRPPRYAFLGVRACELAAIAVLDRVLLEDAFPEPNYLARRSELVVIAVQCTRAAPTCFCASMGTGPGVRSGFDIALTELGEGFLAQAGSERGRGLIESVEHEPASEDLIRQAEEAVADVAARLVRRIETQDLARRLQQALESPHWDDVARRCLACGNCTMVCPTCFCTTVEDTSTVPCDRVERWRKWDSCFTESFSYIHGGSVRTSVRARYRQWLTHKLSWWVDQFDMFGCVGCGRCITWCPAKIDLTQEVSKVVASG
ncbi:MAG: 4Fe-4S dicluster domain-containing protein [Bryobacterales bacterium]|nr:4Fe-4S dicluster domain-containing protein [Bryobacteraceae bacterium]MDW8130555.1 4Fe-4S dicluster domain-containing protein [Bryobacterales bacterium]